MNSSIINKVLEKVSAKGGEEFAFNPISLVDPADCSRKIAFIDGGNLEIIKAADFGVYSLRVFCTIYQDNERVAMKGFNFKAFISDEKSETVLEDEDSFGVDELGSAVLGSAVLGNAMLGNAGLGKIKDVDELRTLLEIRLANKISLELDCGDIIVMDGSFDCMDVTLFDDIKQKGVLVSALAKTSEHSMVAELNKSLPQAIGYAKFEKDYFIRLHERSGYVFRLGILNEVSESELNKVLSLLAKNSRDAVFLGYPYGLIEADRFARVSKKEAEQLRFQLMHKLGNNWKEVKRHEAGLDAHSILDSIG